MTQGPVLVVGASGNLGGAVVRALLAGGRQVRAVGTDVEALENAFPAAEAVRLDLHDPTSFGPALDGAAGLFLMRPPAISTVGPTLNALLDVGEQSGVAHVVFSSVTGADTNRVVPHHRVERHLHASGLSWTILRPGFFAQNLADAYAADIVRSDRIYLPAGRGRAAFVDVRDIGAAAAAVLADPSAHAGKGYALTGPRALDFDEVAAIMTHELGRSIRYRRAGIVGYARHLRGQGLPVPQVLVQTILHTGLRFGQGESLDPALARLLGRAPTSLEQYVHDHRSSWARR